MDLSGYLPRIWIILPWAVVADARPLSVAMVRLLAHSRCTVLTRGVQSLLRESATCWDSREVNC